MKQKYSSKRYLLNWLFGENFYLAFQVYVSEKLLVLLLCILSFWHRITEKVDYMHMSLNDSNYVLQITSLK